MGQCNMCAHFWGKPENLHMFCIVPLKLTFFLTVCGFGFQTTLLKMRTPHSGPL